MIISRKSMLTGVERQRDLPITKDEYRRWAEGESIQRVWPHLSADDREFIISGVTSEEWDQLVPKDEEEED